MSHEDLEWIKNELRWQNQLLYVLISGQKADIDLDRRQIRLLNDIQSELEPKLSAIKIQFGGTMPVGPVTIAVGATTTATVVGFDQNGAPFTGTIPTPVFSVDTPAVATVDPASGLTTGVSAGVANVTASVAGPNGPLTDTETVTVTAVVPVLSSIKINFA